MLPAFRRYVLVNNSGQTITFNNNGRINIKETCYRFNTAGERERVALADDDLGFIAGGAILNTAEIVGDNVIDDTQTRYHGSHIQIEVTHDEGALADGTFDLYMAQGDAAAELETDAVGYTSAEGNMLEPIGSLVWEASGVVDDEDQRSPVFEIGG